MKTYTKIFISTLIVSAITIFSVLLNFMLIRVENILMFYLLGTIIVIIITQSSLWGLFASVLSVLFFNFFFTDPLMSLVIYDPNYISALILFFIISIILGRITNAMQKSLEKSREQENIIKALYKLNLNYLKINTVDAAINCCIEVLEQIIDVPVSFIKYEDKPNTQPPYHRYKDDTNEVIDVKVDDLVVGILVFDDAFHQVNQDNFFFIKMIISDLEITLKRIYAYDYASKNRITVEKERLRNNLLRSISHDIKTPLTTILIGTTMVLDSSDELDNDLKDVLNQVNDEAVWLNEMVENLLYMTKSDDGKLQIVKHKEVIDDIVYAATKRFSTRHTTHVLNTSLPNQVYMVDVDAKLIIQVLVNLIDNAFKHTPKNTLINVNVKVDDGFVYFEIVDNGTGIDEKIIDRVFEQYVYARKDSDSRRSGLGLSISKAIVNAHNGEICVRNIQPHGASFVFKLPIEKVE